MNQKYIDMIYSENHLEHHGVLGQKWGVENGPPYPLGRVVHDMLANGEFGALKFVLRESAGKEGSGYTKKDYKADKKKIKEYKKEYRRTGTIKDLHDDKTEDTVSNKHGDEVSNLKDLYSKSRSEYEDECEKIIDEKVSEEDINKCVELYQDFVFSSLEYDPDDFYESFYESEEFHRANEKAYDITKQIFKEDYPDEYKKMLDYSIEKYGDDSGFEDFHDFRKIFEGTLDEEWDKAEKEFFKNHPEYEEASKKQDRAFEKMNSEIKHISGNIFGERGNEVLKDKYGKPGDTINTTLYNKLSGKIVSNSNIRIKFI